MLAASGRVNQLRRESQLTPAPQLQQLPARIHEATAFNPEFLRWFAPGERVIWYGRSRGLNLAPQQYVIFALYAAIAAGPLWVWLFVRDTDQQVAKDIAFAALAVIWVIGLVYAWWKQVTAPARVEAVLTDRRLYIRTGVFRRTIRRLGAPHDKISRRIHMLRLTGPAHRPLLKLRGFMANSTGLVLLRVDDPRELAGLLKATLGLDLPIRDRTTGRTISAL